MNNVSLIGRFSKDPELRYTASGQAVANFTLAVRNPFVKTDDGYGADFIQCVAWGSGAELIANNHRKGNMIGVDGRIQVRNWVNDQDQTVWVTEVNVNAIHLIQAADVNGDNNNADNGNNGNNGNDNGNRGNGNNNNSGGNANKTRNSNSGNGNRSTGNRNNGSGNRNNRSNP